MSPNTARLRPIATDSVAMAPPVSRGIRLKERTAVVTAFRTWDMRFRIQVLCHLLLRMLRPFSGHCASNRSRLGDGRPVPEIFRPRGSTETEARRGGVPFTGIAHQNEGLLGRDVYGCGVLEAGAAGGGSATDERPGGFGVAAASPRVRVTAKFVGPLQSWVKVPVIVDPTNRSRLPPRLFCSSRKRPFTMAVFGPYSQRRMAPVAAAPLARYQQNASAWKKLPGSHWTVPM